MHLAPHTEESSEKMVWNVRSPDRRRYRRHDLEQRGVPVLRTSASTVESWDGVRGAGGAGAELGKIVDLSSGGIRIRLIDQASCGGIQPDQQIRIRMRLPDYAGISPFVDTTTGTAQPKTEWVGWLAVTRVNAMEDGTCEVAGQLVDMEELDRGMLGLYLSTQPLAA